MLIISETVTRSGSGQLMNNSYKVDFEQQLQAAFEKQS